MLPSPSVEPSNPANLASIAATAAGVAALGANTGVVAGLPGSTTSADLPLRESAGRFNRWSRSQTQP
jgi:hypothetical protein